jgi:uncharacterized repeat protein (TIGR03803 family)
MRRNISWLRTALGCTVAMLSTLALIPIPSAEAQTFQVIYSFTGHASSQHPIAGVTVDRRGNLFGTTAWGGGSNNGSGTVYELRRTQSGFLYNKLHDFGNGTDGSFPWAGVTIGPNGSLYGTTYDGGTTGNGIVYNLQPPASFCHSTSCPWNETILYNFTRGSDGGDAQAGVTFDRSGNLYGANVNGGSGNVGVVFEMTSSNGGWTYQVIYPFTNGHDGGNPSSLLQLDTAGNLYGTAAVGGLPGCGGFGCGTVYKLSPSGSGWTEQTLYSFHDGTDGAEPQGGVIMDGAGNLYGSTCCGDGTGGTLFELSPASGNWNFSLLYSYNGGGLGPEGNLVRDTAGNLYGASVFNGLYNQGVVFKLTPRNGGWIYTSIHDFTGGADGGWPEGGLAMDSNGNIYGTTYQGGLSSCGGCGVVYEITP